MGRAKGWTRQTASMLWSHRFRKEALVVVVAMLCGFLVARCLPDEYTAIAKISDEYKITDLYIGLTPMKVLMRDLNTEFGNEGTDKLDIYSQYLRSEDFIDRVANDTLSSMGITYLQHIRQHYRYPFWEVPLHLFASEESQDTEARDIIKDHIRYNLNALEQTLTLQVIDQDGQVAAEVLRRTLDVLKREITLLRRQQTAADQTKARLKLEEARHDYMKAREEYTDFANAHSTLASAKEKGTLDRLHQDYEDKFSLFQQAEVACRRADYLVERSAASFAVVKYFNLSQKRIAPLSGIYALVFGLVAALLCWWHACYRRRKGQAFPSLYVKDIFSPWTLTVLIWTGILGLYYLLDTQLYPITSQFYYCLAIWLTVFLTCSVLTYSLTSDSPPRDEEARAFEFNKTIFNFFFVISLIITPLYVYRVMQIVMMFSTTDLLNNVRLLAIYGEGQGFLNYSNVINQSLFVVALWAYPRVPLWQVVTLAAACLMNSLAIMEKGTMFFVFVCIIFVLFQKGVIRLRSIATYGVLLVLVFYLFNLARAEEDSDYQQNETLLDFFAMYALSPPVAFCQLVRDVTPQFGANTLGTIYLFLDRFGVDDIIVKQKLQEFVWVPIPTNVYTIFQPFYTDFGYKGVAFFAAVYGVASGWLYRLFRNGNSVGVCLYTFLAEVLVLQFYQENIFLSMVFVLQFIVFVVLFTQQKFRLSFPLLSKHD